MTNHGISRRRLLTGAATLLAATQFPRLTNAATPSTKDVTDTGVRLLPLPARVYKTRDSGGENTESWVIWLLVESSAQRGLKIQSANIQLLHDGRVVRATDYGQDGVRALSIVPPFPPRMADGRLSSTPIYWPQAMRIRCTEAAAAKVDAMRVELTLAEAGSQVRAAIVLPVESYVQKTSLVYPFKGKGIITHAGVTNGGHRNRSGQFALDGVGLDANYGVYISGVGRKSEDYAGWGRALIVPAAGIVVRARADRPDQPDPESSDAKFFAPEYPNGGDPGNYVVIDHGNGEFSMMAHFQAGSMQVNIGDRVQQGQTLGKLGSSGDTETPHLHYQLQSGPDHQWSDGLPCKFGNIEAATLVRGAYFDAR